MHLIEYNDTDPALNLAVEEVLLARAASPDSGGLLMLWQNRPCVVLGRFQNARCEIDAAHVREAGLAVVRRMSGGGAVYHDLGTLNYTFVLHLERGKLPRPLEAVRPVAEALRSLGLPVLFSGRNDLLLHGRKLAGVAHYRRGAALLHHGCILVSTDLDALDRALRADPEKLRSKGVASVRSRVTSLVSHFPHLELETVRAAILEQCRAEPCALSSGELAQARRLREEKYASPDWTYGAAPPFTEHKKQRFPWGGLELFFSVRKGRIEGCRVHGDFLAPPLPGPALHELEQALVGLPYTAPAMRPVLETFPLHLLFDGASPEQLIPFFLPD